MVVTGIGVVTPIGSTLDSFWNSLVTGTSGIGLITRLDTSQFSTRIGGEVKDFEITDYLDAKEARKMDSYCQFAMGAAIKAIEDSNLNLDNCDRDRIGVIVGSGIGGMEVFEAQHHKFLDRGARRVSPFFIPMLIADIAAGHISIRFNLRGPNYATTSACATSAHAVGLAMKTIRYNEADIMVTGGAEAPLTEMGLSGFCALKALSSRNEDPEKASRPFDLERDGFVMAEGAGILVLEELEHALQRGAEIYGEIAGSGFTGDAFHITAPPEDGHGAVRAMRIALAEANVRPQDLDYINAHGTSTQLNDRGETQALKTVLGESASQVSISSTKSMHGHMLGAAGSVELAASLLAMKENTIPPTINYDFPDPECDLDYTPNRAVRKELNVILSNNFGFGGHNASLVVKRFS